MQLLLDTHTLIWWNADSPRLPEIFRSTIAERANTVFISTATVWEISIKRRAGKLSYPGSIEESVKRLGFRPLSINLMHAEAVEELPLFHRDPFDRMLVAQAKTEGMILLTVDPHIMRYEPDMLPNR